MTGKLGRRAIAVMAALVLVGCGQSSTASPQGPASSSLSTPAASGTAELSGKLTVWTRGVENTGTTLEARKQLTDEFMQLHPNVTVEQVPQTAEGLSAAYQAAFTAKSGPDVVSFDAGGPYGIGRWTSGLVELTNMIPADMKSRLTHWEDATADFNRDSPIWGVPTGTVNFTFYYNKQLFTKAGLDPESPPNTYEKLITACKTLKAAGVTPFASGNKEGYENDWWYASLYPAVGTEQDLLDIATETVSFVNPQVEQTLETYLGLQQAGCFPEARFTTPLAPDGMAQFEKGEGAIVLGLGIEPFNYTVFNNALGVENVGAWNGLGVVGERPNWLASAGLVFHSMTNFGTNQEAAWEYIKFMSSAAANTTYFEVASMLPNDITVEYSPDSPPQLLQITSDLAAGPTGLMAHEILPQQEQLETLRKDISEMLQGRMTLQQVMDDVQSLNE